DVAANQRIWLKEEKDPVSRTPNENKPLPPSVALTLNTPEFHELDLLERYGKKLQLIKRITGKWERVATRLYFPTDAIEVISRDSHHQCDSACHTMFSRWLDGEGREPKTWGTLVTVLNEADLSSVANELEKMISCTNESERVSREQRRTFCQVL
ncbi:MAG: death domain-containing protein, partial [Proteobacteria bacterium]|nr:death domain-containing protein [Pseudomonadota bacterium]